MGISRIPHVHKVRFPRKKTSHTLVTTHMMWLWQNFQTWSILQSITDEAKLLSCICFTFTISHALCVLSHAVSAVGHGASCNSGVAAVTAWQQMMQGTAWWMATQRDTVKWRGRRVVGGGGYEKGGCRGNNRVVVDDTGKEATTSWDNATPAWCHTP